MKRHARNAILTARDLPYSATLVDSTRIAPQPAQDELEQRGAAMPVPQPATE